MTEKASRFVNSFEIEKQNISEWIYKLWDELSEFGPQEIDRSLSHLMQLLCNLIGADNAFWLGLVRLTADSTHTLGRHIGADYGQLTTPTCDPMNGWRIGATERLKKLDIEAQQIRYKAWQKLEDRAGDTSRAVAARAGHFRAYTLRGGIVDLEAFKATEHYDFHYRQIGIFDRMWVVFPVSANSESCFLFDRHGEGPSFGKQEILVAKQALRGIKWYHRLALTSHGLGITQSSLTPKERLVLRFLLTGKSEKEIAAKLNVTHGSIHQYCVNIYKKYNVHGRLELMLLWLLG